VSPERIEVAILETGSANLASVIAAFAKLGAAPSLTRDPGAVESARRLVVPGVGTLAAAMASLAGGGLVAPLRERLAAGRRTLAICLGLQLLGAGSEESPGVDGVSAFRASATRFPRSVRTPQLGWNAIAPEPGCRLLEPGYAYFANSYRLVDPPPGAAAAYADYGGRFVAAFERDGLLACQFHPELSSRFGLALLGRWLAAGEEGGAPC
jgi:imidazole glycerol phosphate synthase glutamine amidotransferase subunit